MYYILESICIIIITIIWYFISGFDRQIIGSGNPNVLYHGSPSLIDVFIPKSSYVIDGEKAVFGAKNKDIAMIFIGKWTDNDIMFGFYDNNWIAIEKYPGAFNLLNVSGYIYTLPGDSFKSDPRLGLQNEEYISIKSVKPINKEYIGCILTELKANNMIKLYETSNIVHLTSNEQIPDHTTAIVHTGDVNYIYNNTRLIVKIDVNESVFINGVNKSSILLLPGLGNGVESFNFNRADDESRQKLESINPSMESFQQLLSTQTGMNTLSISFPGMLKKSTADPWNEPINKYISRELDEHWINPEFILGHSIGCAWAHQFAQNNHVKGLILLDPTPQFVKDGPLQPNIIKYMNIGRKTKLQKIDTPTIIIWSYDENDPNKDKKESGIEEMRSLYSNLQIVKLMNATHFIHLTNGRVICDIINNFIKVL
jgi:pimeloyl-ACP methyl ester carboxylesterase